MPAPEPAPEPSNSGGGGGGGGDSGEVGAAHDPHDLFHTEGDAAAGVVLRFAVGDWVSAAVSPDLRQTQGGFKMQMVCVLELSRVGDIWWGVTLRL